MSPLTWPGLDSTPLILFLIRAGWRVGSLMILNTAVTSYCSQRTCRALSTSFSFFKDEKWAKRAGCWDNLDMEPVGAKYCNWERTGDS